MENPERKPNHSPTLPTPELWAARPPPGSHRVSTPQVLSTELSWSKTDCTPVVSRCWDSQASFFPQQWRVIGTIKEVILAHCKEPALACPRWVWGERVGWHHHYDCHSGIISSFSKGTGRVPWRCTSWWKWLMSSACPNCTATSLRASAFSHWHQKARGTIGVSQGKQGDKEDAAGIPEVPLPAEPGPLACV